MLAAFDRFFFDFYPYLDRHIPFSAVDGKSVLEVGLGMGSVSERLARSGALLTGLDIAAGPVSTVNKRLERAGLPGAARVGSILQAPFADESFDLVVSLGCLHHTGDLPRALQEVHRILKPGGLAVVMVYYAYSPKRWILWPRGTLRHLLASGGSPQTVVEASASERAGYDRATDGSAPPETVFTSKRQFRAYARAFNSVSITLENLDTDMLLFPVQREARQRIRPVLLKVGNALGIATEDMYATLRK
jgi:SAM-dependent methyltransferase